MSGFLRKIRCDIPWLGIFSALVLFFLFAPMVIIILFSFHSTPALSFPIRGLSLHWYYEVLTSPVFITAMKNTIIVGLSTMFISTTVGTLAALALTRYQFKYMEAIESLLVLPMSLPGLVLGIALLTFFISMKAGLSLGTVIVSHIIYTLPYFTLVIISRLERFDKTIEEAAMDLGCTPWQTFWRVTFPIIAPSIIGASMVVFALSFDEFLITFFVIGSESTLPMLIWSMMRRSIDPRINAISTLLMLTSSILVLLITRVMDLRELEL